MSFAPLLTAMLLAHGGSPAAHALHFDASGTSAWTSHGFLDEQLRWVCEEIGDPHFATGFVRRDDAWWIATTGGLLRSEDGCSWTLDADAPQELLWGIRVDRLDPQRVWIATQAGLWAAEGDAAFMLAQPSELSLRSFGQAEDGSFYTLGFDGEDQAVVAHGDVRVVLPEASGRLDILLIDAHARAYVRTQIGLQDRLYRVSGDGELEDLFGLTDPLLDVATHAGQLYVVTLAQGTRWSADDGASWSAPAGLDLTCLEARADGLYACLNDGAIVYGLERSGSPDPAAWSWRIEASFSDVEPFACAADTSFDRLCGPLWPLVQSQLGARPEDDEDDEGDEGGQAGSAATPGGCQAAGEPDDSPWTLALGCALVLGWRREGVRRSQLSRR